MSRYPGHPHLPYAHDIRLVGGMRTITQIKLALGLIGVVLVVIVAAQNTGREDLRVLFWRAEVDRLLLFPSLFALGLIVGWLLGWGVRKRKPPPPPCEPDWPDWPDRNRLRPTVHR